MKPVNLRQARKQRDRAAKTADRSANAALHGRTKAERLADEKTANRDRARLDGHKREDT